MINSTWIDAVAQILRTTAEEVIRPRFGHLSRGEVTEKSRGELVTVADREAEIRIALALHGLDTSLAVVGEEAAAEDSSVLDVLHRGDSCWVLDPLDGTANFVAGRPDYGVQLALVLDGVTTASWVLHPESATLWTAQLGAGARRNGVPVHTSPGPSEVNEVKAAVFTRFMADHERAVYEARPLPVGPASKASAIDYPAIAEGALDLVIWSRTLPWDHLPGALLLTEAGGWVSRLDGSTYQPTSTGVGARCRPYACRLGARRRPLGERWWRVTITRPLGQSCAGCIQAGPSRSRTQGARRGVDCSRGRPPGAAS